MILHRIKILAIATALTQFLMFSLPSPQSSALDTTDTTPPTYSISLFQGLPAPGNVMILRVVATDEKNEIAVPLATATQVEILYGGNKPIAPICSEGSLGGDQVIAQIVPLEKQSSRNTSGSYERTFYVILYLSKPKPLPNGCPEWRDTGVVIGLEQILNSTIKDVAGNSLRLSPGDVNGSFLSIQPKAIDNFRYCYLMLNSTEWLNEFSSVNQIYQSKIAPYQASVFAKDIFLRIDTQYSYIMYLQNYLDFTKQNFNIETFRSLPLCPQLSGPEEQRQPLSFGTISSIIKPQVQAIANEIAQKKQEYESQNTNKRITITCVKGKLTKKVTAVNPKCPNGYKKR